MNDFTKIAGIPSGGGQAANPKPERTEVKKPEPAPAPDPFDCQEFHELCMDYRGAGFNHPGRNLPQEAYERLQAYCHAVIQPRPALQPTGNKLMTLDEIGQWCADNVAPLAAKLYALEPTVVPMSDYFKEQQEACLEWPEIDGFEPFGYTERN